VGGMKDTLGDQPYGDLFARAQPRHTLPDDIPEEIRQLFERFAVDVARMGFTTYSADAILHRIRWHQHIERGNRDFKCNNNYTAPLARWFLAEHPELPNFFETRTSKHDAN
jgi:hypothetical protein